MIGLYDKWIFLGRSNKLGTTFNLDFLEVWLGTQKDFVSKYHKLYPNESIQIFRHPKKSMDKSFRNSIEKWMNDSPEFKQYLRDNRIDELLS